MAAPKLIQFSIDGPVDASTGPVQVPMAANFTDDLTGVDWAQVRFRNGDQYRDAVFRVDDLVSGSSTSGLYESYLPLPAGAAHGTWTVKFVMIVDKAGNERELTAADLAAAGLPNRFENTGLGDETAPKLADLAINPRSVDTAAGPATLTVSARFTDNLTGTDWAQVRFRNGSQYRDAVFQADDLVAGSITDGSYRTTFELPAGAANGTWTLQFLAVTDRAGNQRELTAANLAAAGLPSTFQNG